MTSERPITDSQNDITGFNSSFDGRVRHGQWYCEGCGPVSTSDDECPVCEKCPDCCDCLDKFRQQVKEACAVGDYESAWDLVEKIERITERAA